MRFPRIVILPSGALLLAVILSLLCGCSRSKGIPSASDEQTAPLRGHNAIVAKSGETWCRVVFFTTGIAVHYEDDNGTSHFLDREVPAGSRPARARILRDVLLWKCFLDDNSYRWGPPSIDIPLPKDRSLLKTLDTDLWFLLVRVLETESKDATLADVKNAESIEKALSVCVGAYICRYGAKYDYRDDFPHKDEMTWEESYALSEMFVLAADRFGDGSDLEIICRRLAWYPLSWEGTGLFYRGNPSQEMREKIRRLRKAQEEKLARLRPQHALLRYVMQDDTITDKIWSQMPKPRGLDNQ